MTQASVPSLQQFFVPSMDLSQRRNETGSQAPEKLLQQYSELNNSTPIDKELSILLQEPTVRRDRYQKIAQINQSNRLWPSFVKFFQARDFKFGEYKTIVELDCKMADTPSSFLLYFVSNFNSSSHKNVIPILDTYITKNTCCLVSPFYSQGNLYKLVKSRLEKQKFLKVQQVLKYFAQLLSALQYIHSNLNTTMFGGITLENIFLDETLENISLGFVGIHTHTMNMFMNYFYNRTKMNLLSGVNLLQNNNTSSQTQPMNQDTSSASVKELFKNEALGITTDEHTGWKLLDVYAVGIVMFQILTLSLEMDGDDTTSGEQPSNNQEDSLQSSHTYHLIRTLQQQQQLNEYEQGYYREFIKNKITRIYHNKVLTKLITDMLNISQTRLTADQCVKLLQDVHPEDDDDENTHYE